MIAIKATIPSEQIDILDPHIEMVGVVCKIGRMKTLLTCHYIPPTSPTEIYESHTNAIIRAHKQTIDWALITGDFNLPSIEWQQIDDDISLTPFNVSIESEKLIIDSLLCEGLHQLNHIRNCSNHTLDLIFSSSIDDLSLRMADSPLSKVDVFHVSIIIELSTHNLATVLVANQAQNYDFNHANFNCLNQSLNEIDWSTELATRNIEESVDYFYDCLLSNFNTHVPKLTNTKTSHNHPPWYDKSLINMKNRKNRAFRKYSRTGNQADYESYKPTRQEFRITQKFKHDSYVESAQEGIRIAPRKFWRYVDVKKRIIGFPSSMKFANKQSTNPHETCVAFRRILRECLHSCKSISSQRHRRYIHQFHHFQLKHVILIGRGAPRTSIDKYLQRKWPRQHPSESTERMCVVTRNSSHDHIQQIAAYGDISSTLEDILHSTNFQKRRPRECVELQGNNHYAHDCTIF